MQLVDSTLCFGCWKYSPGTGTLWRMTEPAAEAVTPADPLPVEHHTLILEPRLHALLNYFLQQPDKIHGKTDLLDAIWGDAEGTDAALMRAIGMLRKALQDTSKPATYIETLSKRGYRWVAPVQVLPQAAPDRVALKLKASSLQTMGSDHGQAVEAAQAQMASAQQSRRREKHRRLGLLFAFFICAVAALLLSLLLFFGKTNFMPAFTRQVIISAMPGQEQKPLLSPDQQTLYYQQKTPDQQWRWIAHHLSNHRKQVQQQQFDALSAGQWFDGQLVFQGLRDNRCMIYRLSPLQAGQSPEPWLPCQQLIGQGLATDGTDLIWLDMHPVTGATQLWRYNGKKAELQQTFAAAYRRPVALLLSEGRARILLQQDDFNTSLFSFELSSAVLQKVADFPYSFHTMSAWDNKRLLLSSQAGSFLFATADLQLVPLQLASGVFIDQQKAGERLLATQVPRDAADLLPLQPPAEGRSSTLLSASPWLSSNKTDHLLSWNAAQAALVSERSGLPQVWWFDGQKVSQLTRFTQWRQITQLLWSGDALYAVIDQQLFLLSLNDGALSPALFQDRQLRHFAVCHNQWYWAEFSHQQWQLKTMNQQQHPIELLPDAVDVRCAPDQSLLLLMQDGHLVRFWPETGARQQLAWRMPWRQLSVNSWTTTSEGLYWLDNTGQLWLTRWQQTHREQVAQPGLLRASAVYGQPEQAQLFLQLARDTETDVVWLQPQQFQ